MACRVANSLINSNIIKHAFFISASNTARLEEGYRDIADRISWRGNFTDSREIFRGVRMWLEEPKNGSWLVILDDYTENLEPDQTREIDPSSRHLPPAIAHGRLIITTCNRVTAFKIIGTSDACFMIPQLHEADACSILRKRTPKEEWNENPADTASKAGRLIAKLDNNLSAIIFTAAYITSRSIDGETISTYLQSFRVDLPSGNFEELAGSGLGRSPILALQTTYNRISSKSQEALDLLALMSCLDRTRLPKSLLCCYIDCDERLRGRLGILSDHMLIIPSNRGEFYTMPSLVQLTVHEWLRIKNTRLLWQCKALDLLYTQCQKLASEATGSIEAYMQQRQLLPHIDILDRYCFKHCKDPGGPRTKIAERAPALIRFASLYNYEGRPKAAFRFLTYVCTDYHKNDSWKISALKDRAEIMRSHPSSNSKIPKAREEELGRARDLLKAARNIAKEIGSYDKEIDIQSALALNYSDILKFRRAEKYQEAVVAYMEEHYATASGGLRSEVIDAKLRLSKIYFRHGLDLCKSHMDCLEKAKIIQLELFNEMSKPSYTLDFDSQSRICEVQAALARTYYAQKAMKNAVEMARKAHEGRLELFGRYDLWTLRIKQDLAFCMVENGQCEEAKRIFDDAKRKLREKLGSNHFEVRECEEKGRVFQTKLEGCLAAATVPNRHAHYT
jgi:hypothetical protein